MPQTKIRPCPGLTAKGRATVALIAVRDRWATLTPSQRQEVGELVDQLASVLRRRVATPPNAVRMPLLGRIVA